MTANHSASSVLGGTFKLSTGTVFVRLLSTASQFLLILWLSPADFGHWAAAVSAAVFLTSLTNLGLVDGYLAGSGMSYAQLMRRSITGNLVLAALLAGVAAAYYVLVGPLVALLLLTLAVNIPLQGLGEVYYARRLRNTSYRRIVGSQMAGALGKAGVGVVIAALTGSALALGLSNIVFSVVLIVLLKPSKALSPADATGEETSTFQDRFSWAASVLSSKLPAYVGVFVAQFLTSAEILGLYYLSYQIVLAISSVIAPPLKRVALSSMAEASDEGKGAMLGALSHALAAALTVLCAFLLAAILIVDPYVPGEWNAALPAIAIFLSLLPTRFVSPIIDASQRAQGAWWRVTRFHLLDGVVVAIAALSALTDSVVAIALTLSCVRTLIVLLRVSRVSGLAALSRFRLIALLTVGFALLLFGAVSDYTLVAAAAALALGTAWLLLSLRFMRR